MAIPTLKNWQEQILRGVGAPITPANLSYVNAWQRAEGGGATNNPFNTTQPLGNASSYNSVGVRNYATPQLGIQATIQTLNNGRYENILAALRQGSDPMAAANALAASPWGTGALVQKILGGSPNVPSATVPVPTSTPTLPSAAPAVPSYGNLIPSLLSSLGKSSGEQLSAVSGAILQPQTVPTATGMDVPVPPTMQPPASVNAPLGVPPTKGTSSVVNAAMKWIGTPYSWGGGTPQGPGYGFNQGAGIKGFDCSSLLQYAYAKQGVNIPRVTYDQFKTGQAVPSAAMRPGDAVFFNMGSRGPEHVGIYMGSGKFLEAPYTGSQVRVSDMSNRDDFVGARRYG